ncbi:tumor necrosis factor receptor superfamily member 12A [Scyliorhinus canicula]|uniref:tumor necrosis factor receptor superfamily member 12A n=1 Tax=Scyliorhinus canicula TaxID=7830 RepID=UPI0018F6CF87|nr:tumor necrosis factor receptor superfamily member 12A [Scyliorhinus canicula]
MGCPLGQVWNSDLDKCLHCGICNVFPHTPSCNLCSSSNTTPGTTTKRSEIVTPPTLTFIIVGIVGALVMLCILLAVILHRTLTKKTFSKPIEESGEGLTPGFLLL